MALFTMLDTALETDDTIPDMALLIELSMPEIDDLNVEIIQLPTLLNALSSQLLSCPNGSKIPAVELAIRSNRIVSMTSLSERHAYHLSCEA
jgi:hypothetical protein